MKKAVVFAAAAILLMAGSAVANGGSNALMFGFDGLSSLGVDPIESGFIGGKMAMGDGQYVIGMVELGYEKITDEADGSGFEPEDTETAIGLGIGLQKNLGENDGVVPYVGAMGHFEWFQDKSEPSDGTEIKETITTIGVSGLVGFEYFLREWFSLGGNYTFGFDYAKVKDETDTPGGSTESEASGWAVGPFSTMHAIATVYFGDE